ncbi:MAG: MotE family protein [Pseudobdellovibrionaceae bacterium]
MKSGSDQFFQKARKVANGQQGPSNGVKFRKGDSRQQFDLSTEDVEQQIRRRMKMPSQKKKRKPIPWKMMGVSFVGLLGAVWGFRNYEQVENIVKNIEIQVTGEAAAQESKVESQASKAKAEEKKSKSGENEVAAAAGAGSSSSGTHTESTELEHLQKLNERKKELDAREEELNRMENELQVQKDELEKRLKELEEMRNKISSILEERVKADDQKVDTLVQMYTNMKAPQAAKVFETMDEDLAIQILGRMKKKNAADIMNLLKAEKAQTLSEMFAGYKRRSPASK